MESSTKPHWARDNEVENVEIATQEQLKSSSCNESNKQLKHLDNMNPQIMTNTFTQQGHVT